MLRFFRHGDGALALFQGGQESDPKMLASLLARDNYLPHLFSIRGDRQVFGNGIWGSQGCPQLC